MTSAQCPDFFSQLQYPIEYFSFTTPDSAPIGQGRTFYYYCSGYAAKLIRSILSNSGFRETKNAQKASLIVGGSIEREGITIEQLCQRVNHYNQTFSLGSKAGYHHIMKEFAERTGSMPSFYPETYLLPEEYTQLKAAFPSSPVWIQKPAGGSRGNGIVLINQMPERRFNNKVVVQHYIEHPLLINGLKFDLRFYVAVTSLIPLRVYAYDDGLVRLATEPYNDNFDNIENRSAHLTNFSINKESSSFKVTNDLADDGKGNKWSHAPLWPFLQQQGFDIALIRKKIEDAFATVIIAARRTFLLQSNHRSSFELFGFDVMISQNGDISILEVNVSPALGTSSQLDFHVKSPLVKDLFNMALIPKEAVNAEKLEKFIEEDKDSALIEFIYDCEYELARSRLGKFRCIYPTLDRVKTHLSLLEKDTKYDSSLGAWLTLSDEEKADRIKTALPRLISSLSRVE